MSIPRITPCPVCCEPQDYNHLHRCCFLEIREGKDVCAICGQRFELLKLVLAYENSRN